MKIDLTYRVGSGHFLRVLICESVPSSEMRKIFPTEKSVTEADFNLTINGVEVNVKDYFDSLDENFSDIISNRALELLDEKFSELDFSLDNLREMIKSKIETLNNGNRND